MRTFDTNVLVRVLVDDDPEQCRRAEAAWREALGGRGAFVPLVVLVETSWALRSAYRFDRATCAAALRRVCEVEGAVVESADIVALALEKFRQGPPSD